MKATKEFIEACKPLAYYYVACEMETMDDAHQEKTLDLSKDIVMEAIEWLNNAPHESLRFIVRETVFKYVLK